MDSATTRGMTGNLDHLSLEVEMESREGAKEKARSLFVSVFAGMTGF